MLTIKNLKAYQKECILHTLYHPESMLWLQMGLGKTIVSLTSIIERMRARQVSKVLIFAPLRVINSVWTTEAKKWEHTEHLTFSIIQGNIQKRQRALFREANIYLINYENMNWLVSMLMRYYIEQNKPIPFQMIIYDEISMLKNSTSLRMRGGARERKDKHGDIYSVKIKGWRQLIDKFQYKIGLTGTPSPNGYLDLFGQYLAIDNGKRLGKYITHFKSAFFISGYNGWSYNLTDTGKKAIEASISQITLKMDNKDYLDMPKVKEIDIKVNLPQNAINIYKKLEKELFATLDSGTDIELFNKISLYNKCLQICNGSIYTDTETRAWEKIHDVKLKALADILEEAMGSPVLCSYSYIPDSVRIMKYFKKYNPVNLTNEPARKTQQIINNWNEGKIKLLIGHPKSIGHGIDGLQQSGSIVVWYGLTWNYELYEQMNARLMRQGQKNPVSIIRILCNNTIDLVQEDAIKQKCASQNELKKAIDRYRKHTKAV